MTTKVYGASDDLIEFEGDVRGEYGNMSLNEKPAFVFMSDGTVLDVQYGKPNGAIWHIQLVHKGSLFVKIDLETDEDADIYSDIAHFNDGLKWAYVCGTWEKVR